MPNYNPEERDENGIPLGAIRQQQPRYVSYADYKPTEDFTSWLTGYISRIQYSHGYRVNEMHKVRDEVVRSLPGKLAIGPALDTYNRLSDAVKQDYNQLVAKLTEEFTDPRAKKRFNADTAYNVRKKGQTLKDFAETIKKDMNRYSYTPATVYAANGGTIPNPERERQGVRRFLEGMRDENGEIDEAFTRNLSYHIQSPEELTWDNAIEHASRFEAMDGEPPAANAAKSAAAKSAAAKTAESESSSSDEEVKAVETKDKKKKSAKKMVCALADQVHENQMRITKLETAQERTTTALETNNALLQEMSAKMDLGFAQGGYQQQRYQGNYQQPRSQQQQFQLQQQRTKQFAPRATGFSLRSPSGATFKVNPAQNGAPFKANPVQNTWVGKTNQQRQGSFGFNRKTPNTFPAAAGRGQGATKPTVALVEEQEIKAEDLDDGGLGEEEAITIPMSQFLSMATEAGYEVPEESMVAGIEELNFY